ncbi:MAG: hypothetical protein UZ17_ACD001002406 [Acidobacteria bacterium OLB17]|nr:MAG: hypothetical protein UZ17_ACD001002406 [Acidobacteria bacterium OLB17]
MPDGTPLARNVFAGKAVIAELRGTGSGSFDTVTWKTSDPASGTVVSYMNDGTVNTGAVSEQHEPLGQRIAVADPEAPNEPQTYAQHLFFASEPSWQCDVSAAFYGGFQGMPEHCQSKVLMNLNLPLTEIFGWYPESTMLIYSEVHQSPDARPGQGGGHESLHFDNAIRRAALGTTRKARDKEGPTGSCTYDANGPSCKVASLPDGLPSDLEQRLDTANPGDAQQLNVAFEDIDTYWDKPSRRLTRWEMETLRGSFHKALSNSEGCERYINDLLKTVAQNTGAKLASTSIGELLEKVANTRGGTNSAYGGLSVYTFPTIVSNASSNWDWVGAPGFASIALGTGGGNEYIMTMLSSPEDGGMKVIHELMHVAFSGVQWAGVDRDFADAAADLAGNARLVGAQDVSVYSKWWHDHLRQACGFPRTNSKTPFRLYK